MKQNKTQTRYMQYLSVCTYRPSQPSEAQLARPEASGTDRDTPSQVSAWVAGHAGVFFLFFIFSYFPFFKFQLPLPLTQPQVRQ